MRLQRLTWGLVVTATALATVWAIAGLVGASRLATQAQVAVSAAPAVPVTVTPMDVTHGRHWADPSIDPAVLERAYAPVSKPLPPAAQPKSLDIMPSSREWRRLHRQDATLY